MREATRTQLSDGETHEIRKSKKRLIIQFDLRLCSSRRKRLPAGRYCPKRCRTRSPARSCLRSSAAGSCLRDQRERSGATEVRKKRRRKKTPSMTMARARCPPCVRISWQMRFFNFLAMPSDFSFMVSKYAPKRSRDADTARVFPKGHKKNDSTVQHSSACPAEHSHTQCTLPTQKPPLPAQQAAQCK